MAIQLRESLSARGSGVEGEGTYTKYMIPTTTRQISTGTRMETGHIPSRRKTCANVSLLRPMRRPESLRQVMTMTRISASIKQDRDITVTMANEGRQSLIKPLCQGPLHTPVSLELLVMNVSTWMSSRTLASATEAWCTFLRSYIQVCSPLLDGSETGPADDLELG